jgi:hypothetical protein
MNNFIKREMFDFFPNKKLFLNIVFCLLFIFIGCEKTSQEKINPLKEQEIMSIVKEVAGMFKYYEEIQILPNIIVGPSEVGGQCGDYALSFVNLWNEKYPNQALLVIQQQGLEPFPDGFYEVIGKDNRNLPIDT